MSAAQDPRARAFVVASVKPAAPPIMPGRIRMGMSGGPGTASAAQVSASNMSLWDLMANAYNVKPYQINGAAWIASQRQWWTRRG